MYLQTGKHKGEIQKLPKTRSLSEDNRERMRRRLQSAKRSLRQRLEPQPVGSRVRRQGQPQTRSKGRGGEHVTTTWDREEHWRELRTTEDSRSLQGPPGKPTSRTGREEKPQTEVRSPTIRRKGAAPPTRGGRAKPTPDP